MCLNSIQLPGCGCCPNQCTNDKKDAAGAAFEGTNIHLCRDNVLMRYRLRTMEDPDHRIASIEISLRLVLHKTPEQM